MCGVSGEFLIDMRLLRMYWCPLTPIGVNGCGVSGCAYRVSVCGVSGYGDRDSKCGVSGCRLGLVNVRLTTVG